MHFKAFMRAKSCASAAMDAHDGQPRFPVHVHRIHGAGLRALAASNARRTLHFHAATLSLAECIRGTGLYTRGWIAAETNLCLESSAQTTGRADSDPASMPRQALVNQSCAGEGAGVTPYAAFHSGSAKYFHDDLPYFEAESFMPVLSTDLCHRMWLARAGEHGTPEPSRWLYLSPSCNGHCDWHVCELTLPVSDYHVSPPRHGRMNSVMP